MNRREEYKGKLVSAEEAVKVVKSGDRVVIPLAPTPEVLVPALEARKDELRDVQIVYSSPQYELQFLKPGYEKAFWPMSNLFIGNVARKAMDEKRTDYLPNVFSMEFKAIDERPGKERKDVDVFIVQVSPPNRDGFCNFGAYLWHRSGYARRAKKILAEVDENILPMYGDTSIHISQIDYFVEHTPPRLSDAELEQALNEKVPESERRAKLLRYLLLIEPWRRQQRMGYLLGCKSDSEIESAVHAFGLGKPDNAAKTIAEYIAGLIRDGDTIQIGTGMPSGYLPQLGVFEGRHDLGIHSEMGCRGMIDLIRRGIVTGKRKTLCPGKAVFASLAGCSAPEIEWASENPLVELRETEWVVNVKNVSQNENMIAINNAISIDLTGQINSESVFGARLWNGPGGQPESHMGAVMAKGGRALTIVRSTAMGGVVSRIVPKFEEGSTVTIPRHFADYVITEYGIASLMGKSLRQRSQELIAVAHPDFRGELRGAAEKMF